MELKVLITTDLRAKTGQWFDLPSQVFERRLKWLSDKGIEPVVLDILGDVSFERLKHIPVTALNQVVEQLEDLPEDMIKNLDAFLEFESLEELLESQGEHFVYYEECSMEAVAERLIQEGEIGKYIDMEDLMRDYLDLEAVGRDIKDLFPFFQLPSGEMVQYDK